MASIRLGAEGGQVGGLAVQAGGDGELHKIIFDPRWISILKIGVHIFPFGPHEFFEPRITPEACD